jgi:5-formyltetrahydrofolate cyclo-ligase
MFCCILQRIFFSYKIPMANKDELREQAILHRDKIRPGDEDIERAAALLIQAVPAEKGRIYGAYWPKGNEFDVRYMIDDILKAGGRIALPVASKSTREMGFAPWDGKAPLIKGEWGIMIPPTDERVEPDVLLVPFLAFDRKGYRLGRGGGHYDATIEALRTKKDILAVGVGYAAQAVLFSLPVEPHDQKLDLIVTPAGIHDFRN